MNIGQLDRRVVREYPTRTRDTYGQEVEAWNQDSATYFAGKRDILTAEESEGAQLVEMVRTIWTTRFSTAWKATDRIAYDGAIYYVTGIQELGRKEGLRITTEKRNSPR